MSQLQNLSEELDGVSGDDPQVSKAKLENRAQEELKINPELHGASGEDPQVSKAKLESRAQEELKISQSLRKLIFGREHNEFQARNHCKPLPPPRVAGAYLLSIEKEMWRWVIMEDHHRELYPPSHNGEGLHYLRGQPPFWRQPWPSRWRVVKPWDFSMHYNHHDMRQLLLYPELTVFEGKRKSYPLWQKMFYLSVHVQDIDVVRKYNLLLKYTSEVVRMNITEGHSYSQLAYCLAINRLERCYGLGSA